MSAIKLTVDAADWQRQVNGAVKTLEKLFYNFEQERKTMLTFAAQPMAEAMRQGAPVGTKIHVRYQRHEGARRRRGEGQIKGRYYPGNLKGAFRVLDLKKTTAVIVGAKLHKGGGVRGGMFGKSKFDAYYLAMVEFGTVHFAARPFVRPAIISASPAVIRRMTIAANHFAAKFARQNKA